MLLWILSDLHLDSSRGWDLPAIDTRPPFDVLVIAGDLTTRMERGVGWLRERITDQPVIYISGNHEGYGTDWKITINKARNAAADSNIHVLQNDTLVIGDVTFAGATLWADFSLFGNQKRAMAHAGQVKNDYRKIRTRDYRYRLRPQDALAANKQSRDFFTNVVRTKTTNKICAVSHHGPAPATAAPGIENDLISAAYVNDEHADLMKGIHTWIYGHTHETRDFMIGETRVVTNAKGYGPTRFSTTWENRNFDPAFTIEI
ncbi:MAG: metallophosphoesterase [Nitrobacter sp. 62-13]|jgi:3',5'-cyclic AMP phosphodiesterase CpdA|uniref:metallophosphoesterase n=1 Tax=Nitrobacter sp. 62-13 TaxID=1895797 RepID=UPI000967386D|nr:metallophosphoesterase [Nitrobacter sp. 62-13]OJU25467.1 MAG: metallophosphoesterase [Nitrobacter sp. 62-13]